MTGGQALVESLKIQGVDVLFGLPGVQLDGAFNALYDARDAIRVYHTRHEQAASYMADGYARTTGRVGVCLVVPGPGRSEERRVGKECRSRGARDYEKKKACGEVRVV